MQDLKFKLAPDYSILINGEVLSKGKSNYQTWSMFKCDTLGITMVLDDYIMVAEKDEHQYHELIVHPNCLMLEQYNKALIIGGGDGLCAKRVLQYPFKKVTQVEIDEEVSNLSKKYFSHLIKDTFDNPRLEVKFSDALKFLPNNEKYDFISLDLNDPAEDFMHSHPLYSKDFYLKCQKNLNEGGIMVVQVGCPYFFTKHFKAQTKILQNMFKYTAVYGQFMRCYGVHQYFVAASNDVDVNHVDTHIIDKKIQSLGIDDLKLYNKDMHKAMIVMNNEIINILK